MKLPNAIAEWAQGDAVIEDDPMVYYNLSYYLWTQGYDVWLANYRGIGRGDFESEISYQVKFPLDDIEVALKQVFGPANINYTYNKENNTITIEQ